MNCIVHVCTNYTCISVIIMIGMLLPIAYIDLTRDVLRGGQGQPSVLGGDNESGSQATKIFCLRLNHSWRSLGFHVNVKHSTKLFFFSFSFFFSFWTR